MKKKYLATSGIVLSFLLGCVLISCNKTNSSLPVPPEIAYLIQHPWTIDSINVQQTVLNGTTPVRRTHYDTLNNKALVYSSIAFYNKVDSSYIFRDSRNAAIAGPGGSSSLFPYMAGRWSLNNNKDSLYFYTYAPADSMLYLRSKWQLINITDQNFSASYTDTISTNPVTLSKKLVYFSIRTR